MTRVPRVAVALAAMSLVVVAASGCGGAAAPASAPSPAFGSAARAMPAHSLAFVDVDLDRRSAAWRQAVALGARFPGWARLVTQLHRKLAHPDADGFVASRDLVPLVGGEAGFAVTGLNAGDSSNPVNVSAYLAVTDTGRVRAAVARWPHAAADGAYHEFTLYRQAAGSTHVAVGDGIMLLANSRDGLRASIDAWDGRAPRLADDPAFHTAMARVPPALLVTGYADGAELGSLLSLASLGNLGPGPAPSAGEIARIAAGLRRLGALTMSFGAEKAGFRLAFNAAGSPPDAGAANGPPPLMGDVPAQAFAYLGYRPSVTDAARRSAANPALPPLLARVGLSWRRDILPLFSGPTAFYAGPGLPLDAAALLQPPRPDAATAAMYRITAVLQRFQPSLRFTRVKPAGQVAHVGGFQIGWRRVGDVIAISNDPAAGHPQTPDLAASAGYAQVARAAGVPDRVAFLAYVGLPQILAAFPTSATQDPNLAHVGGLVAWASADATGGHAVFFAQIR